jgi:acyl carrier protein
MTDDVGPRVTAVLCDIFDLQPDEVGAATSKDTVESWDSLQHLSLVIALEEEFGVHFGDDETVILVSYPAITAAVAARLDGA